MQLDLLILPGDGIGTEVTCEAVKVLQRVADRKKGLRNEEILLLIQEVVGQTAGAAASV